MGLHLEGKPLPYRVRSLQTPHVQLILDDGQVPPALQTALNRLSARVSIRSMDRAATSGVSPSADVCVILPGPSGKSDMLNRIMEDASERACGTLVIPDAADECLFGEDEVSDMDMIESGLPVLRTMNDRRTASMNADELTGRLRTLCEIRHPLRKMREELLCLRQRDAELASGTKEFCEQLQLASQIQHDLLPEPLREMGSLSVSTLYLPAEFVSGDIYDISQLDEDRIGISIADATGHGVPAALLTIFIKNSFRGKDIVDGSYRILEPNVLLNRLNRELFRTNLTQCQFITGLYAIYDRCSNRIRWSRAGAPYPILLRLGEQPRFIRSEGALLGALDEQAFEIVDHDFQPGDSLLFYTDGLEGLLLEKSQREGPEAILRSPWLEQLVADGPEATLDAIRDHAKKLSINDWPCDDVTAIVLTMPKPCR